MPRRPNRDENQQGDSQTDSRAGFSNAKAQVPEGFESGKMRAKWSLQKMLHRRVPRIKDWKNRRLEILDSQQKNVSNNAPQGRVQFCFGP